VTPNIQTGAGVKTLTLDLGTQTGWTLLEGNVLLASGTFVLATEKELQQQRKEGKERTLDIRFLRLLLFIVERIEAGVHRIVFEDVQFAKTQAQAQLWASLRCAIGCETEFFHGKTRGLLVLAVVTRILVTYEQPPY
jgi:hypothetical protein